MSIQGITFDNQDVNAKVDGSLNQSMIGDGILYGCQMSYLSATFTIGAGLFCIGGRLGRIVGTESLTLASTYPDGYARIKLVVDLTQPSTATQFSQLSFATEYSATDAWDTLTQGNINSLDSTDTLYEMAFAVVKLNGGNIASIVSQAPNTASGFMPLSGGTFTGAALDGSANTGTKMRSIAVKTADAGVEGETVATGQIIAVRA